MASTSYLLQGPRVAVRRIGRQDYAEIAALTRGSTEIHRRWLGTQEHTPEGFESRLQRFEQPAHEGFVVCLHSTGGIVGGVNINNIVRGALQSGTLGCTAYASTPGVAI